MHGFGCEEMTADGMQDMSKRDQLFTRSFHGSTSEGHETYFLESMIPTVNQLGVDDSRAGSSELGTTACVLQSCRLHLHYVLLLQITVSNSNM